MNAAAGRAIRERVRQGAAAYAPALARTGGQALQTLMRDGTRAAVGAAIYESPPYDLQVGIRPLADQLAAEVSGADAVKIETTDSLARLIRVRLARRLCARAAGADPLSLVQVAHACGFANQLHLGNTLRRHLGTTPSHYRRAHEPEARR